MVFRNDIAFLPPEKERALVRTQSLANVKELYYRNKISEYMSSISKRYKAELIELKDESIPKNASDLVLNSIKDTEGNRILEYVNSSDYVIALCIDGVKTTNQGMRKQLDKAASLGKDTVVFIIGGSLGLSDKVVKRANYKLSFSDMTFPHQLMRVMLLAEINEVVLL